MALEQELIQEFGTATFSQKSAIGKGLGWAPVEDERDWKLEDTLSAERTSGIRHWANPLQLDQGSEGACVAFATTGVINAEPKLHSFDNTFAFSLYQLAKTLDPWPGEDYSGTSVRAGAKAAVQLGFFSAYAFTYSVETLAFYLLNRGPVMIGVDWFDGMDRVTPAGYIFPTGDVRGGHSVIVDGVVWNKDDEENRFRIRNSWGNSWGLNGRCRIKADDLQYLFDAGGSACCPVESGTT